LVKIVKGHSVYAYEMELGGHISSRFPAYILCLLYELFSKCYNIVILHK
jgi:hypothetical protein